MNALLLEPEQRNNSPTIRQDRGFLQVLINQINSLRQTNGARIVSASIPSLSFDLGQTIHQSPPLCRHLQEFRAFRGRFCQQFCEPLFVFCGAQFNAAHCVRIGGVDRACKPCIGGAGSGF